MASFRVARRFGPLALLLVAASASPAGATAPTFGSCLSSPAAARCAASGPLPLRGNPPNDHGIAFGPEGRQVYVPQRSGEGEILILARNAASSTISAQGASVGTARCVSASGSGGTCAAAPLLQTPEDIWFNAAGTRAYVHDSRLGSADALLVFTRNTQTGGLQFSRCFTHASLQGCTTVSTLSDDWGVLAVSDNAIYVPQAGGPQPARLTTLPLDGNGDPTGAGSCISATGASPCSGSPESDFTGSDVLALSPDGKQVYAAGSGFGIFTFDRASNGTLTARSGATRCLSESLGTCTPAHRVQFMTSLVVSPDGRNLYGTDEIALEIISRDPATGNLTQALTSEACLADQADGMPGCDPAIAIHGIKQVVVSQNGDSVYAPGAINGNVEGEFAAFVRDRSTGALTQPAGAAGCLATHPESQSQTTTCGALPELYQAYGITIAPDGATLAIRTAPQISPPDAAVLALDRDVPPVCQDASVSVPFETATAVPFSCADANGDAIEHFDLRSRPTKGLLGDVDQVNARVFFSPFQGTTGTDAFTYSATANGYQGDPATAAITIGQPPAATPTPTPTPSPPGLVDNDHDGVTVPLDCNDSNPSIYPGAIDIPGNGLDENCDGKDAPFPRLTPTVRNNFATFASFTQVLILKVIDVPAGATVTVTCRGKGKRRGGCPFKKLTVRKAAKVRTVNLRTRKLKKARLKPGTILVVSITQPQTVGKAVRFKVRRRPKTPSSSVLCIPVGAKRPQATCA